MPRVHFSALALATTPPRDGAALHCTAAPLPAGPACAPAVVRSAASKFAAMVALTLISSAAFATLPPPTPQEAAAQAAKKAAADAQAAKDKQKLAETMDAVAAHWRKLAATNGWTTHAPTALPPPA
ncbi:hypothetical protein E4L96_08435, partial [Massilia arenosa]